MVHANRLRPYHNPNLRPTNVPSGLGKEVIEMEQEQEPEQSHDTIDSGPIEQTTQANASDTSSLILDRIVKAAHYKGQIVYKVRYRKQDGKSMTVWKSADDVDANVRKDFHIKFTFSGKARKYQK